MDLKKEGEIVLISSFFRLGVCTFLRGTKYTIFQFSLIKINF